MGAVVLSNTGTEMETLVMSAKKRKRLVVLAEVKEGKLTLAAAADVLQ